MCSKKIILTTPHHHDSGSLAGPRQVTLSYLGPFGSRSGIRAIAFFHPVYTIPILCMELQNDIRLALVFLTTDSQLRWTLGAEHGPGHYPIEDLSTLCADTGATWEGYWGVFLQRSRLNANILQDVIF